MVVAALLVGICLSHAPAFDRTSAVAYDAAFQSAVAEALLSFDNSTLVFRYPPNCGKPPGAGWWNSANGLLAIVLKDQRRGDGANLALLRAALGKHVSDWPTLRPDHNLFNDDQLWWLWLAAEMAELDGGDARWLNAARAGWAEVVQCMTDDCGSSLSWQRQPGPAGGCVPTTASGGGYKASIASSLLMVLSAKLHALTSEAAYLQMAQQLWSWLHFRVVDAATGLVHDGVRQEGCALSMGYWSYNAGVPLAALATMCVGARVLRLGGSARLTFPVPSLYLPCTFPAPSLHDLVARRRSLTRQWLVCAYQVRGDKESDLPRGRPRARDGGGGLLCRLGRNRPGDRVRGWRLMRLRRQRVPRAVCARALIPVPVEPRRRHQPILEPQPDQRARFRLQRPMAVPGALGGAVRPTGDDGYPAAGARPLRRRLRGRVHMKK